MPALPSTVQLLQPTQPTSHTALTSSLLINSALLYEGPHTLHTSAKASPGGQWLQRRNMSLCPALGMSMYNDYISLFLHESKMLILAPTHSLPHFSSELPPSPGLALHIISECWRSQQSGSGASGD